MNINLEWLQRLAFDALPVLLDAAVKGVVLLAAAGALVLAMRKTSAAARQAVWLLALAALPALPVASAALPGWQVLPGWARIDMQAEPVPANVADFAIVEPRADPHGGADRADIQPAPPAPRAYAGESEAPPAPIVAIEPDPQAMPAPAAAASTAKPAAGQSWGMWIVPSAVAIWLAGTLVCLLPLVLGRLSLWRLARRSRRIEGGTWAMLLQRAAKAVGLRRGVQLLQSDAEPMPMVWGVLRPRLLLPAEADGWSADRRWVVLLHELAHTRRHDCLAKLVAHVACALYWFNPLCWIAFKLMQREAEAACDDLVISADHASTGLAGLRPSDYAQHLLEIASGLKSGMLAAYSSIAMARPSKLEGRLLAILDGCRNRRRLTIWGFLLAAILVAAVAVPLAALKATDHQQPPAAKHDEPATRPVSTGPDAEKQTAFPELRVSEGYKLETLETYHKGEAVEVRLHGLRDERWQLDEEQMDKDVLAGKPPKAFWRLDGRDVPATMNFFGGTSNEVVGAKLSEGKHTLQYVVKRLPLVHPNLPGNKEVFDEVTSNAAAFVVLGPRDASSNRYEYGPTVEMEIQRGEYVNLATAQKIDAAVVAGRPPVKEPQFRMWLADNNVDLFYDSILSIKRWVQVALANALVSYVPSALANWDSLSADQVAEALTIGQTGSSHIIAQYEGQPQPDGRAWLPSRFKTRGGQMGLLQIVRMADDGTSVRVRWKLIQPRAAASQPGTRPATQPAKDANAVKAAADFGPANTAVIPPLNKWGGYFLDVESGQQKLCKQFKVGDANTVRWLRENSADFTGIESRGLTGFAMAAVRVPNELWDARSAEVLQNAAVKAARTQASVDLLFDIYLKTAPPTGPERVALSSGEENVTTYFFRTREGTCGLLQLLTISQDYSNGIKMRYKLVRQGTTQPANTQPASSAGLGQAPNGASTQPATTQPAVSAEKASTLAICVVANTTKQADRNAMISADEADKWKKQLADQGPKAPTEHQRYWWAELGESMMPPPQALIADYRGKPHILLCADWPQAVTPWRSPAFRTGILRAKSVAGSDGKYDVQVTLEKDGGQAVSFIGKVYKGLAAACAIDGIVQRIETIVDPFNETPVIAGGMTKDQAEALAHALMRGMPAARSMREAIENQNLQAIGDLLDANPVLANAACDWPDWGRGPLHTAVGLGSPEIVRLLLDRGANVNAVDKRDGDTPLHQAAASTNVEIVRLLLDRGASLKAENKRGFTPLHTAAVHQSVSAAKILLDAGAEINYAGKGGVTLLDMVVLMETQLQWRQNPPEEIEKTKAVADLLRQHGGKVGIVGAAAMGDSDAVRGFIKADPAAIHQVAFEYMTPLVAAVMAGHVPVAELLIDAGSPVNPPADSPVSALMMAAWAGHLDAVKLLVARGADVNFAGEGTALTTAAYHGHRQIVEFLLDKGARAGDESGDGSALTAAARNGQVEIVKLLLDRGMDVNSRTQGGQTALIALAASTWPRPPAKGVMETAKLLIDRGADVNARDNQNQTALAHTINTSSGQAINMDLVKLLIDHGANVNVKAIGAQGTLLHRAAKMDDPALAKLLIDAGADLFAEDGVIMGREPLEVAEQYKASRAAEVIRKAAEPKVEAMRAKVIESLQPFLDAISKADAKAAMARVLPNGQVGRSNWESWINDQCKIMTNSPGRILMPGIIEIRSGFAVAVVTDAAARPNTQTVITLLGCEDGTWRPVKYNSTSINGIEEFLKDELRGAATFLSSVRLAVLYKAGKLTGPAPNSSMGGSLTDPVRTIEMTVSDGMLTCDFRGGSVPLQWAVQAGPDRVLQWWYGRSGLAWARSLKLTRNDGLVLEARDGKITITRGESKIVLQAVGGRVRMTSGDNAVTAATLELDLNTMKVAGDTQPAATAPAATDAMGPALDAEAFIAASSDSKRLVVFHGNSARVLDAVTGKEVSRFGEVEDMPAISPDGRLVATSRGKIFDAATGRQAAQTDLGNVGTVAQPRFSNDGRSLAFFTNKAVVIYETTTWKRKRTLPGPADELAGATMSGDGSTVAMTLGVPSENVKKPPEWWANQITVWDTGTGRKVLALSRTDYHPTLSNDGKLLAIGNEVVEVSTGKTLWKWTGQRGEKWTSDATLAISPAGDIVAVHPFEEDSAEVVAESRRIELWNIRSGRFVGRLLGADPYLRSFWFSGDGQLLLGSYGTVNECTCVWRVSLATRPAADAAEIERLIKQLGSEKVAEREAAQQALVRIGPAALGALRAATQDKDPERAQRAQRAGESIQRCQRIPDTVSQVLLKTHMLGKRTPMASPPPLRAGEFLKDIATDDRIAELLEVAANGATTERDLLKKAAIAAMRKYVDELPESTGPDAPWRPSAYQAPGVFVCAYLLSYSDERPIEMLDLLVEVLLRNQTAMAAHYHGRLHDFVCTQDKLLLAMACCHYLDLCQRDLGRKGALNAGQTKAIKEYAALKDSLAGKGTAAEIEQVAVLRVAAAFALAGGNMQIQKLHDGWLAATRQARQERDTLKAILPSGVEIELVAVSNYPDSDQPWWRPDGVQLDTPPIDPSDSDITAERNVKFRKIELVFRLGGKADQPACNIAPTRRTDGEGVWWAGRRSKGGKFALDLKVVGTGVPVDSKAIWMDLLVAAGPWETVATCNGRQAQGPMSAARLADPARASMPSTVITARFDPNSKEARVIGIDAGGVEHMIRDFDIRWDAIRSGDGNAGADFLFEDLKPEQFKSFTLQTRANNELIHLMDISLKPGHMTRAQLISAPPTTQPATQPAPTGAGTRPAAQLVLQARTIELMQKRDALLAKADAGIRDGLLGLAKQFPQIAQADGWKAVAGKSRAGEVNLGLYWKVEAYPKTASPRGDAFALTVILSLGRPAGTQPAWFTLYGNLGLVGKVEAKAGDLKLDAALKTLVTDALAPLDQLDKHIAATTQPAAAGQSSRQPASAPAPNGAGPQPAATAAGIDRLIEQLGGETVSQRDAAQQALETIGSAALPALRAASRDRNPERALRAGETAKAIDDARQARWREELNRLEASNQATLKAGGRAAYIPRYRQFIDAHPECDRNLDLEQRIAQSYESDIPESNEARDPAKAAEVYLDITRRYDPNLPEIPKIKLLAADRMADPKPKESADLYQRITKEYPDNVPVRLTCYWSLGNIARNRGDRAEAEQYFSKVMKYDATGVCSSEALATISIQQHNSAVGLLALAARPGEPAAVQLAALTETLEKYPAIGLMKLYPLDVGAQLLALRKEVEKGRSAKAGEAGEDASTKPAASADSGRAPATGSGQAPNGASTQPQ